MITFIVSLSIRTEENFQTHEILNCLPSVLQVMPNTPAQGQVNAGDAILAIGGYDATQLTHAQASQMIKNCSDQLQLTLAK